MKLFNIIKKYDKLILLIFLLLIIIYLMVEKPIVYKKQKDIKEYRGVDSTYNTKINLLITYSII